MTELTDRRDLFTGEAYLAIDPASQAHSRLQ
jgi:hypothetical protein